MLPGEGEIKPSSRCLEHPNTFGNNFTPNTIAFDYRYPIRFQVSSLLLVARWTASLLRAEAGILGNPSGTVKPCPFTTVFLDNSYLLKSAVSVRISETSSSFRTISMTWFALSAGHSANAAQPRNFSATSS
jgi:hypothetical protein